MLKITVRRTRLTQPPQLPEKLLPVCALCSSSDKGKAIPDKTQSNQVMRKRGIHPPKEIGAVPPSAPATSPMLHPNLKGIARWNRRNKVKDQRLRDPRIRKHSWWMVVCDLILV
jgi:hypothetical protein